MCVIGVPMLSHPDRIIHDNAAERIEGGAGWMTCSMLKLIERFSSFCTFLSCPSCLTLTWWRRGDIKSRQYLQPLSRRRFGSPSFSQSGWLKKRLMNGNRIVWVGTTWLLFQNAGLPTTESVLRSPAQAGPMPRTDVFAESNAEWPTFQMATGSSQHEECRNCDTEIGALPVSTAKSYSSLVTSEV